MNQLYKTKQKTKCLICAVDLSQHLAAPGVFIWSQYFQKFGKIHEAVIMCRLTGSGHPGSPWIPLEDPLRATQCVINVAVDGGTLMTSQVEPNTTVTPGRLCSIQSLTTRIYVNRGWGGRCHRRGNAGEWTLRIEMQTASRTICIN